MVDDFSESFGTFINELNDISSKGRYAVRPKLKPVKPKNINLQMPGLSGGAGYSGSAGGSLGKLMNAIRSQESNSNYGAVNRDSGAAGAYQIMPFNLSWGGNQNGWDVQALGRRVSKNEYMNNRGIQDAIAKWQLGNYLKKYGAAGAAVAWYGGPGAVKNMYSKTTQAGGYPSLYAYWTSVLSKM